MKKLILILTILSIGWSCEPVEVEVQDSFDFKVTTTHKSSGKINSALPIEMDIVPERVIEGTKYEFSYQFKEGQGILQLEDQTVEEGALYPIETLKSQLTYTGVSKGNHSIAIEIKDEHSKVGKHTVKYATFDDNSFTFKAETDTLSVFLGEEIPFTFNLDKIDNGSNEVITYDLSYETNNLKTVFVYNQVEYKSGDIIKDISLGNSRGILKSEEVGKSTLKFTVVSSEDETNTIAEKIEFKPSDFDFTFELPSQEIIVGRGIDIVIDITQSNDENLLYTVEIAGQKGEIFWNGSKNIPGTLNNFFRGSFNLTYFPSVVNDNDFIVTVTASNGQRKTKRIPFKALPVVFDFTTSKTTLKLTELIRNGFIRITLNRPIDLAQREPNYYLTIGTNVSSVLIDNGKISSGEVIPLDGFSGTQNESFNYAFTFDDKIANGDITFTVRNDTGYEVSKTVKVEDEQ